MTAALADGDEAVTIENREHFLPGQGREAWAHIAVRTLVAPTSWVDRLSAREAVLDVEANGVLDQDAGLGLGVALGVAALEGRADGVMARS